MRALVTGGAGFIGSHLVDALLARGDEVTVLDDFSTGRAANLAGAAQADVVRADIRDRDAVAELAAEFRPDCIFHLAAQIDVRRAQADPAHDAAVNVLGTLNALEAARSGSARRFVFASTGGAIYGEATPPTPESAPARPIGAYGQAKLAAEGYVGLYGRSYGLPTVSLRFANVYGPRQDPLGEGGVCAIFCGRLLAGREPTIFGDGGQTRDFVFVEDVVEALVRAGESDVTGVFNIGTGAETSVLELVDLLRPLAPGQDFVPRVEAARSGEVRRSALDARRASDGLGWHARTDLRDGLLRTLDSVRTTESQVSARESGG